MPGEPLSQPLLMPDALLFDWDGTLVDSHPVLAAAMNQTLEHYGRTPWTYAEWQAWLGLSARDAFPKEFGNHWEEARQIYLDAYGRLHLDRIQSLAGAVEVLAVAASSSIPCGIVSNKTGDYLRKEVRHFGWDHQFFAAVGAGDSAQDKPSPDPIYDALRPTSLEPGPSIWFIGDNEVDVACGQAAGCTTILVGSAYPDSNPDHRVTDLSMLEKLIRSSLEPS